MKALLIGWFSSDLGTATTGDLLAMENVADRLSQSGVDTYALGTSVPGFRVRWVTISDAMQFDIAIWICGPLAGTFPLDLRTKVSCNRWIAVNVSDVGQDHVTRAFDAVWWRDSASQHSADLALRQVRTHDLDSVGLLFVGPQKEYAIDHSLLVSRVIDEWKRLTRRVWINLDTRFPANSVGQDHPLAIASQIGSVSALITTRLHGAVIASALGVPVLPIDQIPGGGKLSVQLDLLGIRPLMVEGLNAHTLENEVTAIIGTAPPSHSPVPYGDVFGEWLALQLELLRSG